VATRRRGPGSPEGPLASLGQNGGPSEPLAGQKQAGPAAAAAAWGAGDSDPEPEQAGRLRAAVQPPVSREPASERKGQLGPRQTATWPLLPPWPAGRGASGLAFHSKGAYDFNSVVISWPMALIGDSDRGTSLGFVPRAWQGASLSGLRTCH
jgi:hypothetical protein